MKQLTSENVREVLKDVITEIPLSYNEMAKESGLGASTFEHYRRMKKSPLAENFMKVMQLTGYDIFMVKREDGEIVDDVQTKEEPVDADKEAIARIYRHVKQNGKFLVDYPGKPGVFVMFTVAKATSRFPGSVNIGTTTSEGGYKYRGRILQDGKVIHTPFEELNLSSWIGDYLVKIGRSI